MGSGAGWCRGKMAWRENHGASAGWVSSGREEHRGYDRIVGDSAGFYLFLAGAAAIAYFFIKTKSYGGFVFGLIALALPAYLIEAANETAAGIFYFGGSIAIGLYLSQSEWMKKKK